MTKIKRRRTNDSLLETNPEFKKIKFIGVRVCQESQNMLDELSIKYPDLYINKSMVVEAAIRRLYYFHKKGAFSNYIIVNNEEIVKGDKVGIHI